MNYVCGFAYSRKDECVLLVCKRQPHWQVGCWNGIGGKINEGESPHIALIREFHEETGLEIHGWLPLVTMHVNNNKHVVYMYSLEVDYEILEQSKRMNDVHEDIALIRFSEIQKNKVRVIPNLKWLIPLIFAGLELPLFITEHPMGGFGTFLEQW